MTRSTDEESGVEDSEQMPSLQGEGNVENEKELLIEDYGDTSLELEDFEASTMDAKRHIRARTLRNVAAFFVFLVMLLTILCVFLAFWLTSAKSSGRESLGKCIPVAVPVPNIASMTLQEKIGQMMQIEQGSLGNGDPITDYMIGSVLSGGGGSPKWGAEASDWADMVDNFQEKTARTRLRIPIIYGSDAVHGHNNVHGATIFPHHVGIGASRDPQLAKRIAEAVSLEVLATGVRWTFAPAVSVCQDPRWGRCYESYGEVTTLVSNISSVEIGGWQDIPPEYASVFPTADTFVAATAKHFVGDGGTKGGINEGDTQVDEPTLRRVHLPPYVSAVSQRVATVMASYSSWNGRKMHANEYLLTRVLKGELGFQGVVVSDWAAIQKLNGSFAEQVSVAINAGIDMVMVPFDYVSFASTLSDEVVSGRVPVSRIDDAVSRIIRLKQRLGLFDSPSSLCAPRQFLPFVGCTEHRQLAQEAVRASLVLLKNEKRAEWLREQATDSLPIFPLLPPRGQPEANGQQRKILVAGSHAHDIGLQCGGWTMTWQGGSGPTTQGTTFLEGIEEKTAGWAEVLHWKGVADHALVNASALGFEEEEAQVADATAEGVVEVFDDGEELQVEVPDAHVGVVIVGEPPYAETKGDDPILRLNGSQIATVRAVCGKMPCVLVLVSGRPVMLDDLLPGVDALVAAWLPGSEGGGGLADLLFGDYDFSARLPFSWFREVSQLPMVAGSRGYDPLFPFGFGLRKDGQQIGG